MAALAFVHAVFPMAIVRLLIFPHMILESVFLVGTLNARLVEFWSKNNDLFLMLPMLNFYIQRLIINFYSLYPPLLWICFGMAASFRLIYKPDVRDLQKAENRDVPLIWVWFLLSFLPFIVVYTEQVHLMYALVPASIIMIRAVEYLFIYVWRVKFFCNYLLRLLLIVMVSVIASDHILNLYGSWRVVQGINKGISNVGDWFEKNTPSQSIVICNVLHGEDIRLTSHNHVQIFWTRRGGHPRVEESLDSEAALKAFLEKIPATQTVYFLDIRFPYTYRGIQYFHEHEYLNTPDIALQNMGLIYTSQIRYPYVDPLKVFIPPWAISFLGAPDLENDFYRGPCRDGKAFCREVYAEYHLYKLLAPRPSSRL
jgi:hypothetical protein